MPKSNNKSIKFPINKGGKEQRQFKTDTSMSNKHSNIFQPHSLSMKWKLE